MRPALSRWSALRAVLDEDSAVRAPLGEDSVLPGRLSAHAVCAPARWRVPAPLEMIARWVAMVVRGGAVWGQRALRPLGEPWCSARDRRRHAVVVMNQARAAPIVSPPRAANGFDILTAVDFTSCGLLKLL